MKISSDTTRVLRPLLATLAFRASRSLHRCPTDFETARSSGGAMTAGELVLHMTNVLAFAHAAVTGKQRVRHEALGWHAEIDRFYALIADLDAKLAEGAEMEDG